MPEHDKFRKVIEDYEARFGFDKYYASIVDILKNTLQGTALEIGAATGILPAKLDLVWDDKLLTYYSVDPVEEAVDVAGKRIINKFSYIPQIGTLETAIDSCGVDTVNALITSRSLHEIFLGYGRDVETLYLHLAGLLERLSPHLVIHGILESYQGLNKEETLRMIEAQKRKIGHGHDPAKDYLNFNDLVTFMQEQGYLLEIEHHFEQPLEGFEPSPWRFAIGVFETKFKDVRR